MTRPLTFLRANGVVQHYTLHAGPDTPADAPVIVFVNALGTDFRIWNAVAAALDDKARVLLYDKRGHGLSDTPPAPFGIDDYVDDLLGLLDGLAIAEVALVGLSMGGLIAQRLAVRAPARLRALVLSGTAARIGTDEAWATRIAAVETDGIEAIADAVLERWFTPPYRAGNAVDLAGWRNMLTRTPVDGYLGACIAIRNADFRADAARIGTPTLCIVGDGDGSTPPDVVRETAVLMPGARFAVIEGAGHIPGIEQPAALLALIGQHFRGAGIF
ncbi:3-oxoadipate enol-lactonase [Pseudochelatococcus sp. B33]